MIQCRPEIVQKYLDGKLSTAEERVFEEHLAICRACQARLDLATSQVSQAVFQAFQAQEPSPHVDRRILDIPHRRLKAPWARAPFATRALRVALIPAALVALAAAAWYATPILSAWRFPGGDAGPIHETNKLRGLKDAGFEISPSESGGGGIGAWTAEAGVDGFATIDPRVAHSGKSSLKLVKRDGSGQVTQWIDLPLPKGTNIGLCAWVLSPTADFGDNKYFVMALGTRYVGARYGPEKRDDAICTFSLVDASPVWRPLIVNTQLERDAQGLLLTFSAGAGRGTYTGWDRATWVDDVLLEIVVPIDARFVEHDARLKIEAQLPKGYSISLAEPILFSSYYRQSHGLPDLPAKVEPSEDGRLQLVVDDPKAVSELRTTNPDTGGPPTGTVSGHLNRRGYSVAFKANFIGYLSSDQPATAG